MSPVAVLSYHSPLSRLLQPMSRAERCLGAQSSPACPGHDTEHVPAGCGWWGAGGVDQVAARDSVIAAWVVEGSLTRVILVSLDGVIAAWILTTLRNHTPPAARRNLFKSSMNTHPNPTARHHFGQRASVHVRHTSTCSRGTAKGLFAAQRLVAVYFLLCIVRAYVGTEFR